MDIVTLGPAGTYSEMAAKRFASEADIHLADSIREVIGKVISGEAEHGVLPLKNSIEGDVNETLNGIHINKLVIKEEMELDIHHCLAALETPTNASKIKTIYSHPQAFGQCRKYLEKNYPNAKLVQAASTVAGMQIIKDKKDLHALAIGPEPAAKAQGLVIIDKNIEDEAGNTTRFVLFSKSSI